MFMTAIHVVVWLCQCFVHYTELEHVDVASMVEEVAYHIIAFVLLLCNCLLYDGMECI